MTDKQIIIDGIDVSGCCCYENSKCLWTKRYYENNIVPDCEKVKDCYYKRMMHTGAELNIHKTDKERAYKRIEELQTELKAKEQECEELKKQLNFAYEVSEIEFQRYQKLKQTLTEIKEVLQYYKNSKIGVDKGNGVFEFEVSNDNVLGGKLIYCYDTNPAKQALQKISECEVNNG